MLIYAVNINIEEDDDSGHSWCGSRILSYFTTEALAKAEIDRLTTFNKSTVEAEIQQVLENDPSNTSYIEMKKGLLNALETNTVEISSGYGRYAKYKEFPMYYIIEIEAAEA